MFEGIVGSIIGEIAKAFFSAFGSALSDMFKTWRTEQEAHGRGVAETERDQARAGEAKQADLAQAAANELTEDDAIKALEDGRG